MKTIGPGLCREDMPVGYQFKTVGRTITESDLVNFINTSRDPGRGLVKTRNHVVNQKEKL